MDRFLEGKTAVVTGAARRLGRAIALGLGAHGANIVVHNHRSPQGECEALCGELERLGVRSWIITADFERPEEYEPFIGKAMEIAGGLDILVNSASLFTADTVRDADFSSLVKHMEINAWAPFVLIREFARRVAKGRVVNLLDTRISGYDWKHLSYILSKRALHTLTRMTALEFGPGVTVNAVAPGLILPPAGKDEGYLDKLAEEVPLRRHGGPEDVVEALLFLVRSDFITGQVIFADGGRHLMEEA